VTRMARIPPSVSVVVPVYNRANTIRPAVESVLRQTWSDFELIVVDDGSTDGTLAALAAIADPRLRVIASGRNAGAAGARNAGLDAARGTWIAFQDSDDEWLPLKLEKQMARLLAPGARWIGAYCGLLILGGLKDRPGDRLVPHYWPPSATRRTEGDIRTALLGENLVSTQTLVARLDTLRGIGGFDTSLPAIEDWDLALRLAERGPIAFVDEPLVLQRFSPNSLTRDRGRHLAARISLVNKNRTLFARDPAMLARQHGIIANGLRDRGEIRAALRHIALACRTNPRNPRLWCRAVDILARLLPRRGGPADQSTILPLPVASRPADPSAQGADGSARP
jgi:glycosyltransferase involved in cell wall biosynthesis